MTDLSIIIVLWNFTSYVLDCVEGVYAHHPLDRCWSLVAAQLSMKSPVWVLMSHVDVIAGSSG